jgi:hypothetical protein
MTELGLPFLAMWLCFVLKMNERIHVRQLMQKCNEEAVWIQICIDTDTVVWRFRYRMTVITKYTSAFMRQRQMYRMRSEKWSYLVESAMW